MDKERKAALLTHLILENNWHQALVFSRTKHGANKLAAQLEKASIPSAAIHGNKSQNQRTKALADFKQGKVQILVATDIAARGIDIDQLPQVVNFDLPHVPEDYVHRIGRTGRAGATGRAISLVSADESKQLRDIERVIRNSIEREVITGFEPSQPLTANRPGNASSAGKPGDSTRKRRPTGRSNNNGNSASRGNRSARAYS